MAEQVVMMKRVVKVWDGDEPCEITVVQKSKSCGPRLERTWEKKSGYREGLPVLSPPFGATRLTTKATNSPCPTKVLCVISVKIMMLTVFCVCSETWTLYRKESRPPIDREGRRILSHPSRFTKLNK
jgi:hypothetical protein